MRVLALARFRLRGALSARVLLAPGVALVALQVVGLAGGAQPAAVLAVTSAALALPPLAWVARQVLDAEPDDQVLLSALAVGGPVRGTLAGLLAAYAIAAPLAVLCALGSLLRVDQDGMPAGVLLAGGALALVTALAAVGIGAFAARSVAGRGGTPVVVLVGAPVLVAVLGLAGSPWVSALVPRLVAAVRATNPPAGSPFGPNEWLVPRAPAILLQILLWAVLVLALRLVLARRRS
ncbi:MAG TPA: hypothetical protein VFR07_09280 [Mycobacteriales bacterium]|jgi:hypothetical protein|nr:hypothetical protein [Mycobacteriales bacterium]